MAYENNEADPNVYVCTKHLGCKSSDGWKKKQKQWREMDGSSIESVNTQSLHNKSVPGLPLSVLHCIQAF